MCSIRRVRDPLLPRIWSGSAGTRQMAWVGSLRPTATRHHQARARAPDAQDVEARTMVPLLAVAGFRLENGDVIVTAGHMIPTVACFPRRAVPCLHARRARIYDAESRIGQEGAHGLRVGRCWPREQLRPRRGRSSATCRAVYSLPKLRSSGHVAGRLAIDGPGVRHQS